MSVTEDNIAADLKSATILTAADITFLAYDTYTDGNLTIKSPGGSSVVDPVEEQLEADGWKPIVGATGQVNAQDSYQGVAFYKTIGNETEVIIGNRGSQSAHDFLVSDAAIAGGVVPRSDPDALTYYKGVVNWLSNPANGVTGTVNVIETGHSLGGQEADFVDVVAATNSGISGSLEAVTFDAPGLAKGLTQPNVTYDALNISLNSDFVHVGGALLGAGYVRTSVTVKADTPLAPFLVMDAVGILASGGSLLPLELAGSLGFAYNGLYANHVSQPMRSFLALHPAFGGVNLQTYQPDEVTQSVLNQLVTMSAATYEAQQPAQLATFYQSFLQPPTGAQGSASGGGETYTPSYSDSGVTLVGSLGDQISTLAPFHGVKLATTPNARRTPMEWLPGKLVAKPRPLVDTSIRLPAR